jgi:hypothetical protein
MPSVIVEDLGTSRPPERRKDTAEEVKRFLNDKRGVFL